jgi:hypothetical protein
MYARSLIVAAVTILFAASAAARPPRVTIEASSAYDDGQTDRSAEVAFDGRLDTSWSEGQAGAGVDEWIEIDFGEFREITSVFVWGGEFSGGSKQYGERNRLKVAELIVTTDGGGQTHTVEFGDRYTSQEVRVNAQVRKTRLVIKEVYEGSIFDNTHVAEIAFDYPARMGEGAAAMSEWKEGKAYEAELVAYEEALDKAFDECKVGENYSANFKFISNAAVYGAPYLQAAVLEHVPAGYRGAFMEFDEVAIKYLQKLKDVNVIPYLETGVAKAMGEDRFWLEDLLKAFRAHEELISSRRPTIPNWGVSGLEPGALNGRGEPLAVDVNSSGLVHVADTANNRVQWYATDGRLAGGMGREAGIAWSWFGSEGDPYATGAAPGDGAKEFEQPVYLAVGNYDVVAVIDSTKRVQTFDEEGNAMGDWVIPSDVEILSGRGCATPIISWWEDHFFFMLGREVWGYQATGEQVIKFETSDDILAGVILDGRLLVRHEGLDVVEYAIEDGFCQGKWLRKPVEDDGSEDWDMATDAEDNLYVATDAGWVYVYNKRGKFDRKIQVFTHPKNAMRIAVSPGMETLYVTAEDTVHRVDLSQ